MSTPWNDFTVLTGLWRKCPIIWRGNVDAFVEKVLQRQRRLNGDEAPFQKSGLGQGEIGHVAARGIDRLAFENDHNARLVRPGVIFAHDSGLPQTPDIGDLVAQVGLYGRQRNAWLEPVESKDLHEAAPM